MTNVATGKTDRRADRWWWHPWSWMLAALGSTGLAFVWARCLTNSQAPLEVLQVPMVVFGLVAAGIAIWRRCASTSASASLDYLSARGRRTTLLALAAQHALVALAVSAVLVSRLVGVRLPGDLGGDIVLGLLTAPWCAWSARCLYRRANDGQPLSVRLETAVLVTQGGLVALLAAWALYWGPELADAWDSMRLFFGVLAVAAFLAAPIVAAEPWIRRLAVSALVLVHLIAVVTPALGMQPGPFIVTEMHLWIFRPYLEFMHLNNGYRFYSPEPNAASQLWFRLEYRQAGRTLSRWVKLPDMDDNGAAAYPTGVQLTRRLALAERVAQAEPMDQLRSPLTVTENGQQKPSFVLIYRDLQAPAPIGKYHDILGVKQPAKSLGIPYHPELQLPQNYFRPTLTCRKLLEAYARYILAQPHPEYPNAKATSVKIYRVLHRTLPAEAMAMGGDPRDWTLYVPYYQGQFDKGGSLLDPEDPFLYWVVPIVREPNGTVKCYVFKHAGDEEKFLRPMWR